MKVLVVEDDRLMRVSIQKSLQKRGCEVITAMNGTEAFYLFQKDNPDLVVSDIKMPGLSGLELYNVLKQFDLQKTPLILISSMKKKYLIQRFKGLDGNSYMEKPINMNSLYKKIQILTRKRIENEVDVKNMLSDNHLHNA
jgi:two-component system response regulator VanR